MHLVQVLLPLFDNTGQPFSRAEFSAVRRELTARFGGATAYTRAAAEGTWIDDESRVHHDEVVVVEVMVEDLDRQWWSQYRGQLATRFRQEELVVRAMPMTIL